MFSDHRAGEYAAGVTHKIVEQSECARAKVDFFASTRDASSGRIERQITKVQDRRFRFRASSQQGPPPRHQFLKLEGFGQIVVGTGVQPQDLVLDGGTYSQK